MSDNGTPKKPRRRAAPKRQTIQTLEVERTARDVVRRARHERERPAQVVEEMRQMRHQTHVMRARMQKNGSMPDVVAFLDTLFEALGIWRDSYPTAERLSAVDAEYAESEARGRLYAEALLLLNDRLPPAQN